MTDCKEFFEQLSAYADGDLQYDEWRRLEEHVKTCAACASVLEAYREVSLAVRENLAEPPAALSDGVMKAVYEEKPAWRSESGKKKTGLRRALTRYVPLAACLAVILVALPRLPGLGCGASSVMPGASGGATSAYQSDAVMRAQLPAGAEDAAVADGYSAEIRSAAPAAAPPAESAMEGELADDDGAHTGQTDVVMLPEPSAAPEMGKDGAATSTAPHLYMTAVPEEVVFDNYYAVIVISGELPELLSGYESESVTETTSHIRISRETAEELIALGAEHELYARESETALVVHVAAVSAATDAPLAT